MDDNPACRPDERIKAVANVNERLQLYAGPDGLRFRHVGTLNIPAQSGTPFDSVNTVFYDGRIGKYRAYVRDYAPPAVQGDPIWIRSIGTSESAELFPASGEWPRAQFLRYDTPDLWQMYTNSVMPYERADHIFVGFPVRYSLRPVWTDNYDELCGREARLVRVGKDRNDRLGLSLSDTLFMCSRDGLRFHREEEAFIRPGPEGTNNWVYGDCYPCRMLIETPARLGSSPEMSIYRRAGYWDGYPVRLDRYCLRLDGFVSRHATYETQRVVTKPLVFTGDELRINFATSARGRIFVTIRDEAGRKAVSYELFGDATDRVVDFAEGAVADFAGRPVVLEFEMSDADLYALRFATRA